MKSPPEFLAASQAERCTVQVLLVELIHMMIMQSSMMKQPKAPTMAPITTSLLIFIVTFLRISII